jgi:hypothetical protein
VSRESESRFTATVRIAGINPYVEVPARCVDALARGHRWKVLVKFARAGSKETRSRSSTRASISKDAARLRELGRLSPGGWFRTTIVPSRSGAPRLYVDQWMRKVASLSVGDRALVALRPDRNTRTVAMPATLRVPLAADPRAKAAWLALPPSRQREILSYLSFLKTPAARDRNVRKTITMLLGAGREA